MHSLWSRSYPIGCFHYHVCSDGKFYSGSWSSRIQDRNQWIQVEFNQVKTILGIVTKGRAWKNYFQYVKTYGVLYRTNESDWITVTNNQRQVIKFDSSQQNH